MGKFPYLTWIPSQFTKIPLSEIKVDLTGKTVIVTGANAGLGMAIAQQLAGMNPTKLILACRSETRGNEAVSSIQKATSCQTVETWSLDLASFKSIKAFADRFEREGGGHLDLLIQNAATYTNDYEQTEDGWETSIQINHLGPSFLALLLLPYLLKAPPSNPTPRIVVVGSEGHYFAPKLPETDHIFEKLSDKEYCTKWVMRGRYPLSKSIFITILPKYLSPDGALKVLANFFTRALASRLPMPPSGTLTVTCVDPGFCKTQLIKGKIGLLSFLWALPEFLLARTTEQGAGVILWSALKGESTKVHGRYTATLAVREESDYILSEEGSKVEEQLWTETIEISSKADARIKDIIQNHLSH